jgi:hypothetical protein
MHLTPTSASWLNTVERFFRDPTQNRIRRGVFLDIEELIMAIEACIDFHNDNPKPFSVPSPLSIIGNLRDALH